jgi:TatD DNase family protein
MTGKPVSRRAANWTELSQSARSVWTTTINSEIGIPRSNCSEDFAYAERALEMNLFISFAGNVTYRNARNLHETAKQMPLERMLIESESPFMVPAAYRGKRNKPSYLKETAAFIAEMREMPVEEFAETIYQNSINFLKIGD